MVIPRLGPMQGKQAKGRAALSHQGRAKPSRMGRGRNACKDKVKEIPEYGMVPPPPSYAISSELDPTASPPQSRPLSAPPSRPASHPPSRPISTPKGRTISTRQGRTVSPRQYVSAATPATPAMSLTKARAAVISPAPLAHKLVNR